MPHGTTCKVYEKIAATDVAADGIRTGGLELTERALAWCEFPPHSRILDVGCGTGVTLEYFKKKGYNVWGIDNSKAMLEIATRRISSEKLFKKNMTNFKLAEKFDAIICLFDTVNHLTKFSDWKRFFVSCSKHLSPRGVLIFDMNTLNKLNALIGKTINRGNGVKIKISRKENIFYWKVTTPSGINIIKEKSFPITKVSKLLKNYFSIKKIPTKSGRVYFICRPLQ